MCQHIQTKEWNFGACNFMFFWKKKTPVWLWFVTFVTNNIYSVNEIVNISYEISIKTIKYLLVYTVKPWFLNYMELRKTLRYQKIWDIKVIIPRELVVRPLNHFDIYMIFEISVFEEQKFNCNPVPYLQLAAGSAGRRPFWWAAGSRGPACLGWPGWSVSGCYWGWSLPTHPSPHLQQYNNVT